jgi:transcriptional regulator with XRE-family HTH domain
MLTLKQYRSNLGWSVNQLQEETGLSYYAVTNAEKGRPIRAKTAKVIADVLSKALGEKVLVSDIEGLNIQ